MSTTVVTSGATSGAKSGAPTVPGTSRAPKLTFGGVLRSEFIKLFTLRSTWWCILIVVVLSVGIGLLLASVSAPARAGVPAALTPSTAQQQSTAATDATAGVAIGELVLAVLGVLVIAGEYGTGMIRSTFAAVPKRLPALFAKAIVLGVTAFVVGLVSIYLTAVIIFPILPGKKVHADWGNFKLHESLVGGAVYLALIALIAFCIGAIIRNNAGGIAAAIGLIIVVPTVLQIVARVTQADWAQNLVSLLPSSAGQQLYGYVVTVPAAVSGIISLDRTTGGLVMIAWLVVLFVAAAVLLKRRDA